MTFWRFATFVASYKGAPPSIGSFMVYFSESLQSSKKKPSSIVDLEHEPMQITTSWLCNSPQSQRMVWLQWILLIWSNFFHRKLFRQRFQSSVCQQVPWQHASISYILNDGCNSSMLYFATINITEINYAPTSTTKQLLFLCRSRYLSIDQQCVVLHQRTSICTIICCIRCIQREHFKIEFQFSIWRIKVQF